MADVAGQQDGHNARNLRRPRQPPAAQLRPLRRGRQRVHGAGGGGRGAERGGDEGEGEGGGDA
jgi:hypothetical protein